MCAEVPNEVDRRRHLTDRCRRDPVSWVVGYLIWMCVLVADLTVITMGLLQYVEVMT